MKFRCTLEGVGAAFLLLFYYRQIIEPSHLGIFHHGLPVTHLIGGYLVDLLGVALFLTGLLFVAQYLPGVLQRVVEALFAGLMLWRIVDFSMEIQTVNWLTACWMGVRKDCLIGALPVSVLLALGIPRIGMPVVHAVRLFVAAYAFSALWIVPQLMFIALLQPPVQHLASAHAPATPYSGADPRIIWILFDELSYDQTFDHPSPGVDLPNLHRLRSESVSFSNLEPAGFYTQRIIPSLFLGQRIDTIRSTFDGNFWYEEESSGRWLAYDPRKTLFGLAKSEGWSTGVDEWTFPYCRILASVLDACTWEPSILLPMELYGASEEKSIWANAAVLPQALLSIATNRTHSSLDSSSRDYREILSNAATLIDDTQIRFVFLHFPIPHPPGIYDRQRHKLRKGGTYLDNLVLADDTLGLLLGKIDGMRSSSRTTVIVSSDHSWRLSLYRHGAAWSTEEERASGARFDDRPVLLIHFPEQRSAVNVQAAVPELLEHDMISGMLRGEIKGPGDLYRLENKSGGWK